jgi:predicted RNA-binding Zn-ribbon protein involved in translation (DUF1610 family)
MVSIPTPFGDGVLKRSETQRLLYRLLCIASSRMMGDSDAMYTFVCPECAESMDVNDSMRHALLENGCVICGASLTESAFTRTESTDYP